MEKLREQLAEQEKKGFIRHYNEVLVSVTKEAVEGLFCNLFSGDKEIDCLSKKIAAISRQAYLKEELGRKKNIYVINSDGLRLYPLEQQKQDLNKVIANPELLEQYAQLLTAKGNQAVSAQGLRTQLQELIAT